MFVGLKPHVSVPEALRPVEKRPPKTMGEIVGELDPKKTTVEELGLYMAGAKRMEKEAAAV